MITKPKLADTDDKGRAPRRWLAPESKRDELIDRARAAGMYPRNLGQAIDAMMRGDGVLATARAVGISKNTASRLFRILSDDVPPCACGRPLTHSGWCAARLSKADLPINAVSAAKSRHATERKLVTIRAARRARVEATLAERRALVTGINRVVPHYPDQDLRAEVTQEIFLAILEGSLSLDQVRARLGDFIARARRNMPSNFTASMDAEKDDRTLHDTIPAEDRIWEESDEWDFETHCFGCGTRGAIRRIHGHWQCEECGCVIETCCDI